MGIFHGTGTLIRFTLRRDRLYLPLWILGLVTLATFFVPMLPSFFGDEQSTAVLVEMMKNPALIAMVGNLYGESTGAMFAMFLMVWTALALGIFNILFVVRHTRKDEEAGREEIIASLPVGRSANLLAVLVVALCANLLFALLSAAVIPSFGVEGVDFEGGLVFSLAIGSCGFVFAALTAFAAQLFQTSKATTISAFLLLGIFYLLRAAGDMDSSYEIASLISPLGLCERTEAWVGNLYWPVYVLLAEALCFSVAACVISSVRDTGAGLIPERSGRAHASSFLRGEWSLAWRLTRGICIGWTIVMLVLGASYATIVPDISDFMESNLVYSMIIGSGASTQAEMMDSFIAFLMMLMAVVSAIPVCMVVLKLKSEEAHGRVEQLIAKPVNRVRLMSGFIGIAVILSVVLLAATPLGMYGTAAAIMDTPPSLETMLLASLNFLPALVALIGLSAVLVGVLPRLTSLMWVYLGYCFLMSYMGNTLIASASDGAMKEAFEVILKISPFGALPLWPEYEVNLALTVGMSLAGVVLCGVGLIAYRRRDLAG